MRSSLRPVSRKKPTRTYCIADGVQTYPDGREECLKKTQAGRDEYRERLARMVNRQHGLCALCGKPFNRFSEFLQPTFDHQSNRGKNLDERIVVDGNWQNAALHAVCNTRIGSRRFAWVDGKYTEVSKQRSK